MTLRYPTRQGAAVRAAATLAVLAALCWPSAARAEYDWFAVAHGNTVTAHRTLVDGSRIDDMFGASLSTVEPGNTIFFDAPEGTVHWVEFRTAALLTLEKVYVAGSGDTEGLIGNHDFRQFRLYAKVNAGDGWGSAVLTVDHPEDRGGLFAATRVLATPVEGRFFRAEFDHWPHVGYDPRWWTGSPRILELQGYGVALLEPAGLQAAGFAGLGLVSLLLRRRRA